MTDVLMLAIVAAFFLLAGALVVGCDRILGPDTDLGDEEAVVGKARGDDADDAAWRLPGGAR